MNLYQFVQLKSNLPEMKSGDTVKVYEKISGEKKKKSQIFEGVVIARKHGKGINATFTVRAILEGIGVEKIYPLHSPLIEKIEVLERGKARRAKLYYLRNQSEKKARKRLRAARITSEVKEKENKVEPETEAKQGK